jgi:UDP-N-acetylmuramate--alanine ligase
MGDHGRDRVHLIGAGGIGMSALGQILLQKGIGVSGSDLKESELLRRLGRLGAEVHVGHHADHISPATRVVCSSDIREENVELRRARELGCPISHRSELLQELMSPYKQLLVAGTHGKTTVSSLLVWLLLSAGREPAYALGGVIKNLSLHGKAAQGDYFVAEADESDRSFLRYSPFGAILTNVEMDHFEHYSSLQEVRQAFSEFAGRVSSSRHLIWCGDDPWLKGLSLPGCSYGLGAGCLLRAVGIAQKGFQTRFILLWDNREVASCLLPLVGQHNVVNATGVAAMASQLGLSWEEIQRGFASFPGVCQRLEKKGENSGVLVLDDYAHHPTEIRVTLAGLREAVGSRPLIAVVQPHRYSRWQGLLAEFEKSLAEADAIVVTDVYGKGEQPVAGIEGAEIAARLKATYLPRAGLAAALHARLRRRDVVITLGAGNLNEVADELSDLLASNPLPPLHIGLIFGGPSLEHEVSLQSAMWFADHSKSDDYQTTHFAITRKGNWIVERDAFKELHREGEPLNAALLDRLRQCAVVIPVLHGDKGEDGLIPALLELLGLSAVGCDFRSSSLAMDKILTKHVARSLGIRTAPFVDLWRQDWESTPELCRERIAQLAYPLFVKPAHLGSTYGVSRVTNSDELEEALRRAFSLDQRAVVEEEIVGREMEFCVLQMRQRYLICPPAEVLKKGKIHTFESKYGAAACDTDPHPHLSEGCAEEGREQAEKIFRAIGGRDLARIDFFLDREERWWLNEINPFPGCTPTSVFPLAWKAAGWTSEEVVNHLIAQGLSRGTRDSLPA